MRSSRRREAGPRSAARPTACGSRRPRTTTATSRSRTCRRSTSTEPGSPGSARPLPELPAARRARYRDELGLSRVRRRGPRRGPGRRGAVRGDLAADPALAAKTVANWVSGEYLRLRNAASNPVVVAPAELAAIDRRGRRGRDLPGQRPRGARGPCRLRRRRRVDHRIARLRPDLRRGRARHRRRRGPGRQSRRRRRLPRGQGAGRRLPRRPGHEGDPRPGERGHSQATPCANGSAARPATGRPDRLGRDECRVVGRRRGPDGRRLSTRTGTLVAIPGAQGAGRQRRALRGVARRPSRGRHRPARPSRWRCCAGRPRSPRRSAIAGFVLVFLGFLIR